VYHLACCILFYSYSYGSSYGYNDYGSTSKLSPTWLMLGSIAHLVLGGGAVLLLMFGNQAPRISKRTGGDKRTGNFPFSNKEAYKRKGI